MTNLHHADQTLFAAFSTVAPMTPRMGLTMLASLGDAENSTPEAKEAAIVADEGSVVRPTRHYGLFFPR